MGDPFARTLGKYTVVDLPLLFEAGDLIGRVTYATTARSAACPAPPEFA